MRRSLVLRGPQQNSGSKEHPRLSMTLPFVRRGYVATHASLHDGLASASAESLPSVGRLPREYGATGPRPR